MPLELFDPAAVRAVTQHAVGDLDTTLLGVDGLWVALVEDQDHVESAVSDLTARMRTNGVPSGILILSQSLAAETFGPVPPAWLAAGISMHRSAHPAVRDGAYALLQEYLLMLRSMADSLEDLDKIAQAEPVPG